MAVAVEGRAAAARAAGKWNVIVAETRSGCGTSLCRGGLKPDTNESQGKMWYWLWNVTLGR